MADVDLQIKDLASRLQQLRALLPECANDADRLYLIEQEAIRLNAAIDKRIAELQE
jgi:hypothetical protein